MKLYIKLFFITGIPFGIIMGMVSIISERLSIEAGIYLGVETGLFYGFFMSLILGTRHRSQIKKLGLNVNAHVSPIQTETLCIEEEYEIAFEKALRSLMRMKANIISSEKYKGEIVAKTPMSWSGFGEDMTVHLSKEDESLTRVSVTSRPVLKATMIDYGKGRKNIVTFFEYLKV